MGMTARLQLKKNKQKELNEKLEKINYLNPIIEDGLLCFNFSGAYNMKDYYSSLYFLTYIAEEYGEKRKSPFGDKSLPWIELEEFNIYIDKGDFEEQTISNQCGEDCLRSVDNYFKEESLSLLDKILKNHNWFKQEALTEIKEIFNIK